MTEKDIKEVVLKDLDSVIGKAMDNEEFTNEEITGLITAKSMIKKEVLK